MFAKRKYGMMWSFETGGMYFYQNVFSNRVVKYFWKCNLKWCGLFRYVERNEHSMQIISIIIFHKKEKWHSNYKYKYSTNVGVDFNESNFHIKLRCFAQQPVILMITSKNTIYNSLIVLESFFMFVLPNKHRRSNVFWFWIDLKIWRNFRFQIISLLLKCNGYRKEISLFIDCIYGSPRNASVVKTIMYFLSHGWNHSSYIKKNLKEKVINTIRSVVLKI